MIFENEEQGGTEEMSYEGQFEYDEMSGNLFFKYKQILIK